MQRVVVSVSFIVTCEKQHSRACREAYRYDSTAQQITSHHTLAPYHATASREESDSSSTRRREISPLLVLSLRFRLVFRYLCPFRASTEAYFSPFTYT
jgi:hypothetical protein